MKRQLLAALLVALALTACSKKEETASAPVAETPAPAAATADQAAGPATDAAAPAAATEAQPEEKKE
jgi:nitrous oxide reductase accessory protein NosL